VWPELDELERLLRLRLTTRGDGDGSRAELKSKPPFDWQVFTLLCDLETLWAWVQAETGIWYAPDMPESLYYQAVPGLEVNDGALLVERTAADLAKQARLILDPPASDETLSLYGKANLNTKSKVPVLVDRRKAAKTVGVPPAVLDAWVKRNRITNYGKGNRAPQYDLAEVVNHASKLADSGPLLRCGTCGSTMVKNGRLRDGSQRWRCLICKR